MKLSLFSMFAALLVCSALVAQQPGTKENPKDNPSKKVPASELPPFPKETPPQIGPGLPIVPSVVDSGASRAVLHVQDWPGGHWVDGTYYAAGSFRIKYDATKYHLIQSTRQQCNGGRCTVVVYPVLVPIGSTAPVAAALRPQASCTPPPAAYLKQSVSSGCGQPKSGKCCLLNFLGF